jgi:Fic-DOC domain mobile mystery protein B
VGQILTSKFQEPDGATPLQSSEREGLKQHWITTRGDLNIAEQDNILKGMYWANRQQRKATNELLQESFILRLHREMFGDVWQWGGSYRLAERHIGIEAFQIKETLSQMLGDVRYWIDHKTFAPDEIAIRLHHRLVAIHPFPNGNGRHSRQMADLLVERLGGNAFSWGGGSLIETGELRRAYISALQAADAHDIAPLVRFART